MDRRGFPAAGIVEAQTSPEARDLKDGAASKELQTGGGSLKAAGVLSE